MASSSRSTGSAATQGASGLRALGTAASETQRGFTGLSNSVTGTIGHIATFITRLGFTGFGLQLIATQVQHAGQALFGFDANLEQTRVALTTLLGSASAAGDMLTQLEKFAAITPFDLPGVENASRQLLAFGFQAQDIIPMLTSIGDAVSAMGGGVPEINRVTLALGQMSAAGRVNAQDLMQLTQVGIPAYQILADKMGLSTAALRDMVTKGAVPAQQAIIALTDGMEERYKGAMADQSKTMLGIISNIKDSWNVALGQIMTPAFEVVKADLKELQDWMASPAFATWADHMQASVEQWTKDIQGFVQNDGPGLIHGLETAATAAEHIAGYLKDVYNIADDIAGVFGGQGWEVLLGLYAAAKIAPPAIAIGNGLAGMGGAVGGGVTGPALSSIPLMNVTADVVNVNGAAGIGASGVAAAGAGAEGVAAGAGAAAAGISVVGIAAVAAIVVPLAIGVYMGYQQYGTGQKQVPGRGTAPSGHDYLAEGAQAVANAPGPQAFIGNAPGGAAASNPLLNMSQASVNGLTQSYGELDKVIQAVKDGTLDLAVAENQTAKAESDAAKQYAQDQEMVIQTMQDIGAQREAELALAAAQVAANQAVTDSLAGLADTYQVALSVEAVYGKQQKEYKGISDDIGAAIDIINQKKKDGIPLTSQENLLLDESGKLQGRLAGGMQDATEQQGFAAAAAAELMQAQDKLNQLQRDGVTSGSDYEQAVKDVQSAQENAKQFGGDPMAQSMSSLHDIIQNDLVAAIDNLIGRLKDIVSPPPIEIQIADAAAIAEINRIKAMIESGAYMPMSVGPATSSKGYASGGTVPRNMVAKINEFGPELVVFPYAGAFAAGGTVGIANGGQAGYAALPAGTQVIPAGQTQQVMSALQQGLTPTQAILSAATSDGQQIAKAMIDGIIAGCLK